MAKRRKRRRVRKKVSTEQTKRRKKKIDEPKFIDIEIPPIVTIRRVQTIPLERYKAKLITGIGKLDEDVIRLVPFKGELSNLISLIEQKGLINLFFYESDNEKVINFRINDVLYIWSEHQPDKIFGFNLNHENIITIINFGSNVSYEVVRDLLISAYVIYLVTKKGYDEKRVSKALKEIEQFCIIQKLNHYSRR